METPFSYQLLSYPGVWISDTDARAHITPYNTGMIDVRKGGKCNSVTIGNGKQVDQMDVGVIVGVSTSNYGKEVSKVKLKDVIFASDSKCNLLSVTTLINEGWKVK